ncbi:hypothetical protein C7C46_23075 [Streptomyces tateyamensis]|uniref:Uncharacterized protein n=1 Tax=Streptomyces tateyamensis TaxID=565073 RepID=A0A2V4NLI8_9ACTN|nr:hypothetical protein [Streptomyces tateyamensis]PYC76095.1 hypothetical protein C7C46_23075 [Streptomyces tateyamensis]
MSQPDPAAPAEPSAEVPTELWLAPPAEPPGSPAPRRPARAVTVALATAGLLAVTAVSATVTVAVGKPDHPRRTAAAAAAPSSGASASASAPAAPSSSPSPTPVPVPSLSLAPAPGSTVHGTVNGNTHGGDLRYFLLPIPDGGESYGSPDGVALTMDDLSKEYSKSTDIKSVLDSYNYQESVYRQYRTADGRLEVSARLMRFSSRDYARDFAKNATFSKGDPVDVDGDSNAKGYVFKPEQQAFTGELIGVSFVGDVEYEITVDVKGDPDKALLADAMKRERDRLSSGG